MKTIYGIRYEKIRPNVWRYQIECGILPEIFFTSKEKCLEKVKEYNSTKRYYKDRYGELTLMNYSLGECRLNEGSE